MRIDQDILYAPCPCGSGKKFKFCCFEKVRDELHDGIDRQEVAALVEGLVMPFTESPGMDRVADSAAIAVAQDAVMEFEKCRYAESAKLFRQARTMCPAMAGAWDGEATSLWNIGEYDMAREVAQKSLECPDGGSAFGLAQLASFEYFLGNDGKAYLAQALERGKNCSLRAARKICEALAVFRQHEALFDYARQLDCEAELKFAMYAGLAAANLGKWEDTRRFIELADEGGVSRDDVAQLAGALADGETPKSHCPMGDWQYFTLEDYPPSDLIGKAIAERRPEQCNVICDVAEILLAEGSIDRASALEALASYDGGRVSELRRALSRTDDFDNVNSDRYERFATAGNEIAMQRTLVDFGFGPAVLNGAAPNEGSLADLPDAENFDKFVRKLASADLEPGTARWEEIREFFHSLHEKHPDRPACGTNYANMLREEEKFDEADSVLDQMRNANPKSVYVAATALRFALYDDCEERAATIIRTFRLPGRVHPTTYEFWLNAKKEYYEYVRDDASIKNLKKELVRIKQYSRNQIPVVF